MVKGDRIGISNLDNILMIAQIIAPKGEQALRNELLRLVKIYNYVPSQVEMAYEDALYSEYLRMTSKDPKSARD